jgi:hypothetical protein
MACLALPGELGCFYMSYPSGWQWLGKAPHRRATMINRIKTYNILNGIIFSIVEFVITALIIAPFAIYYIIHGRVLYATVAIGIIFNCLTIVAFGVQQRRRREKDVGIQHTFNKSLREQINREYPHLGNDTWILTTTILLPFVMFIWVVIELL